MNRISELRKAQGLSLEKLGQLCQTSKSFIWELENKDVNCGVEKAHAIAGALGVNVEYLFGLDNSETFDSVTEDLYQKFKSRLINELLVDVVSLSNYGRLLDSVSTCKEK